MADEKRLRILSLLGSEASGVCVCELVDALRLPQYEVSRQLSVLRECALVAGEKRGTWVYYRVSPDLPALAASTLEAHFNMVMTLGCPAALDDRVHDAIESFYEEGGVKRHWISVNDYSQPDDFAERLVVRGYEPDGAWERVVLQGVPSDRLAKYAQGCEIVALSNADEWSQFLVECYRMPPLIGDWLKALVGSRGWTHAIRREGGRPDGKVVMARSLYQDSEGWAWLGIDAPVLGVMAPCFEDDQKVVATLLANAAARGARAFVSDIEVPSLSRDSEAYQRWGQLGCTAVYLRKLYSKARGE